jgi:tRNA (guanine-N7-)-methyltransferase
MGRVRTIKNARELLPQFKHFCNDAKLTLAKQNPIIKIEIGCGKGIFLLTHATHSPQTHFYGVEIIPTIIYKALNKIQQSELARPINNLWLLNIDANDLTKWFKPESIDTIYLNFSDP